MNILPIPDTAPRRATCAGVAAGAGQRRRRVASEARAFSLIELMVTVAVLGILAVVAISGVTQYLYRAKTAEATNSVTQIGKLASASYFRDKMSGAYITPGGSSGITQSLCLSAANNVPAAVPSAAKYVSGPTDWRTGDAFTGWTCLKFEMLGPQYYQYGYSADASGTGGFTATAIGDLAGSGNQVSYTYEGRVVSGAIILAPQVLESQVGGGGCSTVAGSRGSWGAIALAALALVATRRRLRAA